MFYSLPRCCATSSTSLGVRFCTSRALRMGGSPSSNWTSTTAPITATTRPLAAAAPGFAAAAAAALFSAINGVLMLSSQSSFAVFANHIRRVKIATDSCEWESNCASNRTNTQTGPDILPQRPPPPLREQNMANPLSQGATLWIPNWYIFCSRFKI